MVHVPLLPFLLFTLTLSAQSLLQQPLLHFLLLLLVVLGSPAALFFLLLLQPLLAQGFIRLPLPQVRCLFKTLLLLLLLALAPVVVGLAKEQAEQRTN